MRRCPTAKTSSRAGRTDAGTTSGTTWQSFAVAKSCLKKNAGSLKMGLSWPASFSFFDDGVQTNSLTWWGVNCRLLVRIPSSCSTKNTLQMAIKPSIHHQKPKLSNPHVTYKLVFHTLLLKILKYIWIYFLSFYHV